MINITFKRAQQENLRVIQEIAKRTIDKCYRPFLGDEGVDWYINSGESDRELRKHLINCDVMFDSSSIVAFTIYFNDFIHLMMVDVKFHRSGLGSKLLDHSEKKLFANGYKKIKLETFEGNIQAVNFYLKNGWTVYKKEKDKEFDFIRVFFEKSA